MDSEDSDPWQVIQWFQSPDDLYEAYPSSYTTPPSSPPSSSSSMVGAGLRNLGNTCFVNAVLQCLTHTVPIVQTLRSCNHQTPCPRVDEEGFCVVCAFHEHVNLSLAFSRGVIAPNTLVDKLNRICSSFRGFEQQDAHEFLQSLLDKLDSNYRTDMHLENQLDDNSLVRNIFGGRLRSQLQCSSCGHSWSNFEPFMDLSLEIEGVTNLASALESFTKAENIEDTKFDCESCKEKVFVQKRYVIEETTSVAAFHLKRFKTARFSVEKIDNHAVYPLTLDLQPYSSDEKNEDLNYKLYAVIVHRGNPNLGHYFCYIRSSPQTWHKFNDSQVMEVSEESALSQEAYILFYARESSPWFATLMEDQKQFHEESNPNRVPIGRPPFYAPHEAFHIEKGSTLMEDQKQSHDDLNPDTGRVNSLPPLYSPHEAFYTDEISESFWLSYVQDKKRPDNIKLEEPKRKGG